MKLPCLVSFRCMLEIRVEISMNNFLYLFIEDITCFGIQGVTTSLAEQTDSEYSLCKPPHRLQACTKNLPTMKISVYKTSNSQP